MVINLKSIYKIIKKNRLYPILIGIVVGLYPFLFYVSNNFYATNSLSNWLFYLLFFIGIPVVFFSIINLFINNMKGLIYYKNPILFVFIIFVTAFFTSYASSLLINKKLLLTILAIAIILSFFIGKKYKKLIPLILIVSIFPFVKLIYKVNDYSKAKSWLVQNDEIEETIFINKPNVYMIQPDGYVGKKMMNSETYNYNNKFYDWLENNQFKLYDNFRSNYPASLNSNASMFAMRQHYFSSVLLPSFEMPFAREVISGNNPVVSIFKKNGYQTFFIVEDEYFQQNKCAQYYDYQNIDIKDIPYFGKGGDIKRDVLKDLKLAFTKKINDPKFFFIEKCLPHHVHFNASGERVEIERKEYILKIEEVNIWLKKVIGFISEKDPNAIIIILSDHGGWVGIENYQQMFSTKKVEHINSIFSNLAAIKWNDYLIKDFDKDLVSNVNVFRVLFSILSNNKQLLDNFEADESFNLSNEKLYFNIVKKVIAENGKVVNEVIKN